MPEPKDYADRIAEKIVGGWLRTLGDSRTVAEMVAAGVRAGYNLGSSLPK